MTETAEDEFTELYDGQFDRVDLVKTAANGTSFLVMKSGAGAALVDATEVRALLTDPVPTPRDVFAAVAKAQQPTPDNDLPEDVAKEAAVTAPVTDDADVAKAADDPVDGLDPTVTLADADPNVPGDPLEPGSPAWEAVDAATAVKWLAILARAKNALCQLADREAQEAVTVDPDDADNAFDMQDAASAVDYAISLLAPFAVGEQLESDTAAECLEVMKAAHAIDPADVDLVEQWAPVVKAGRVLSAANEQAIRNAVESLQNVLNSLPAAPQEATVTKSATDTAPEVPATVEEPVAKAIETPVSEPAAETVAKSSELTADATPAADAPVEPEPVAKAKGDPQMAVFDANGNLVGTIDPGDLSPIAAPEPPAGGDSQGTDDDPAQPDQTTIPGTDTVQSPVDDDAVAKSAAPSLVDEMTSALTAALKEAQPTEAVIKAALAPLEERLARVEAQPASGGPLLNGGTGSANLVHRTAPEEDDRFVALRKAADEEKDPDKQAQLRYQLAVEVMKSQPAHRPTALPSTWDETLARFQH